MRRFVRSLQSLPKYEPPARLLGSILERAKPQPKVLRPSFYYAAAAAVTLIAALTFLLLLSLPRPAYVAYRLPSGEEIRAGQTVHAAEYTELTLPSRGLAYLREDSRFELASPRDFRLDSGEIFLAVHGAYAVQTPDADVRVEGTRFGVGASGVGTQVYVLEGRVRVRDRNSGEERTLNAGDTLRVHAGTFEAGRLDEATGLALWLAGRVPPSLTLDARVMPGNGDDRLVVTLRNTGPAPALVGLQGDPRRLVAEVTGPDGESFSLNLDLLGAIDGASPVEDGCAVVDASRPLEVSCPLRRDLFPRSGRYAIRVVYFSVPLREGAWVGKVESAQPVLWEAP